MTVSIAIIFPALKNPPFLAETGDSLL
ncbi:leucyl-tRNA synthetase [Bacillus sp. NRRL B-14911]|nr:leucyl-tRNA synthetase [Bacillus sp. NRRL B-14911]